MSALRPRVANSGSNPRRVSLRWALALLVVGTSWCLLSAANEAPAPEADAGLRARIREMREGIRDVPLPAIVEAISGHRVLPWDGAERERLVAVAGAIGDALNAGGVTADRVNEAGNAVERYVLAALEAQGFEARRPAAASGRARAAGYPDLEAMHDGHAFYIEVKVFSASTEDSTQRTFYLSPSADFKVTRDAFHLLVAVELATRPDGRYRAVAVRWLDLAGLRCDLKYEFNASNRDLYAPEAGLVVIESVAGGH